MKFIGFIIVVLSLAACSSTNQMIIAEYEANPDIKIPPISVFRNSPSDVFYDECKDFDAKSLLHHCELNRLDLLKFSKQLKATSAFDDVLFADKDVGYRLLVTSGSYNFEGGEELGSAVVSGATLMMLPVVVSANIKLDVALYWYEYELRNFNYDIPLELRMSLFSMEQDTDVDIAKSVASHVVRDLQEEGLFSAEYLASKLDSSNYSDDLLLPDTAYDYSRQEKFIFNHPFRGAAVRYIADTPGDEYIDVFVYPIRSTRWDDPADVLEKEASNVKQDIKLNATENELKNAWFGENQLKSLPANEGTVQSMMFESGFEDTLTNEFESQTYLMVFEDKFVKVRHTALKGGRTIKVIDKFVTELLNNIKVPEESLFMAKVRKRWRDSNAL